MDVNNQPKQLTELQKELAGLIMLRDRFTQEKAELIVKMQDAQNYIDNKDNVMDVLNELNTRTQARTKLLYEQLLTTLLHEMKPNDPENDAVVLRTEIKRNRVSLDIDVKNKQGFSRNVYYDKGGSVENIIAMGLRFIAVSRTSNRRLIVMDESDHALRSEYIPTFARILAQLSKQIGMQVIYVSHHPASSFEGYARIIQLQRHNGILVAEQLFDFKPVATSEEESDIIESMNNVGLKYIRLINVKQHENTLVELSPYVNIITGDVDVGKSTITQAIDAVSNNLGREGLIRDNESSATIEIGLENNATLKWSYKRKGAKKTQYVLLDSDGEAVKYSDDGSEIPVWLHDYLGMEKNQDFDLHISDQHNSSFILDKKISSSRRAELLSLGREASDVQKMMSLHAERVDKCTRVVNEGKKTLNHIKNKLEALYAVNGINSEITDMEFLLNSTAKNKNDLAWLGENAPLLKTLLAKSNALSVFQSELLIPSFCGEIQKTNICDYIKQIEYLSKKENILSVTKNIQTSFTCEFTHVSDILAIGQKIKSQEKTRDVLCNVFELDVPLAPSLIPFLGISGIIDLMHILQMKNNIYSTIDVSIPLSPVFDNPCEISVLGQGIAAKTKEIIHYKQIIAANESELVLCQSNKDNIIKHLGGICPLCQHTINNCKDHSHE